MANSENSKIKILLLYEYFMRLVSGDSSEQGATMQDIITYLHDMTGTEFERKSIYSDIDRINACMRLLGKVDPDTDWIYREGRRYIRGDVKGELTLDEARLIVDAINTTEFTDSGLCEKIKLKYPAYFQNGYKSLVSHDNKAMQKPISLLNVIRTSIDEKVPLTFKYGYIVASGIRAASVKVVSPLALDFENSHYYLIAVDNNEVASGKSREESIKRYRTDRMRAYGYCPREQYLGFTSQKDKILEKYLKNSVDAYASSDSYHVEITLKCSDQKELLRAFTGFTEDMNTKIISDRIDNGEIKFSVETGLIPPFFTKLFKVGLYKDVSLTIGNDKARQMYKSYLESAISYL